MSGGQAASGPGPGPALTPRQIARRRRLLALRRTWADFRSHRSGLLGLGVLGAFVLIAVFAPL